MHYANLFSILSAAFDKKRCHSFVKDIYENDRFFSFSAFEKTAEVCERLMNQAGLSEIEKLPLKADGETPYFDWVIPKAWTAKKAFLATTEEKPYLLANYQAVPCSLIMYSAKTFGPIDAEVVIVDSVLNENINVKDKIIFTRLPAKELVPIAVNGSALGIITDFFPLYKGVRDSREQMKGSSRWDNDFITPNNDTGLFGFSLSPENGDYLRNLIKKSPNSPTKLKAEVDTEFYEGVNYTISGAIQGTDKNAAELMIYGHLYEPGANDNASGCAVILELAHCLCEMIKKGILPNPKRTIRFVMGYECAGSMGYLYSHEAQADNTLCCVVADMVGTEKIDNTHMCLWQNPMSNLSFADIAILEINREYQEYIGKPHPWEKTSFTVGSDNIIGDPIFKIPTIAMITEPALSYHSSMDTPDRIDLDILKRNGIILGTFLCSLCQNTKDEMNFLSLKIKEYSNDALSDKTLPELKKSLLQIAFNKALLSVTTIELNNDCASNEQQVTIDISKCIPAPENVLDADALLIPKRLIKGCLTFNKSTQLLNSQWKPAWNDYLNLPLFWTDGRRNLWEISILSSAEQEVYSLENIKHRFREYVEYFKFLAKNNYIAWVDSNEGD